ncbi:hypothetical protein NSMM_370044 [Nitrosomonas mobilis]|uniref:Uncharacterized protein n=1 Tax=Nitrosomonas mobilis TaxID=51642 RepID=A0A1G5SDK3_9PROT|nr:hypothetical protein NSMM_370044 [Nitrosomonas mobilis]
MIRKPRISLKQRIKRLKLIALLVKRLQTAKKNKLPDIPFVISILPINNRQDSFLQIHW